MANKKLIKQINEKLGKAGVKDKIRDMAGLGGTAEYLIRKKIPDEKEFIEHCHSLYSFGCAILVQLMLDNNIALVEKNKKTKE